MTRPHIVNLKGKLSKFVFLIYFWTYHLSALELHVSQKTTAKKIIFSYKRKGLTKAIQAKKFNFQGSTPERTYTYRY